MPESKTIPTQKTIINYLSNKYDIDPIIMATICRSPFSFAAASIANNKDEKTLMFAYFGKIKLLKKFRGIKEIKAIENEQAKSNYKRS